MEKLNTPSFSSLIPRERRIRAIQELYSHVGNGTGGDITEEVTSVLEEKVISKAEIEAITDGNASA